MFGGHKSISAVARRKKTPKAIVDAFEQAASGVERAVAEVLNVKSPTALPRRIRSIASKSDFVSAVFLLIATFHQIQRHLGTESSTALEKKHRAMVAKRVKRGAIPEAFSDLERAMETAEGALALAIRHRKKYDQLAQSQAFFQFEFGVLCTYWLTIFSVFECLERDDPSCEGVLPPLCSFAQTVAQDYLHWLRKQFGEPTSPGLVLCGPHVVDRSTDSDDYSTAGDEWIARLFTGSANG